MRTWSACAYDRSQAVSRRAGGGIAILQTAFHVGHPTTAIKRQHLQPRTVPVIEAGTEDFAAPAMLEYVGREFGHHQGNLASPGFR